MPVWPPAVSPPHSTLTTGPYKYPVPVWPPAVSPPHSALTTGLCSLSEEAALSGSVSADLEASPKPTNPESPTMEDVTNPETNADLELELAEPSETFVLLTMF